MSYPCCSADFKDKTIHCVCPYMYLQMTTDDPQPSFYMYHQYCDRPPQHHHTGQSQRATPSAPHMQPSQVMQHPYLQDV